MPTRRATDLRADEWLAEMPDSTEKLYRVINFGRSSP